MNQSSSELSFLQFLIENGKYFDTYKICFNEKSEYKESFLSCDIHLEDVKTPLKLLVNSEGDMIYFHIYNMSPSKILSSYHCSYEEAAPLLDTFIKNIWRDTVLSYEIISKDVDDIITSLKTMEPEDDTHYNDTGIYCRVRHDKLSEPLEHTVWVGDLAGSHNQIQYKNVKLTELFPISISIEASPTVQEHVANADNLSSDKNLYIRNKRYTVRLPFPGWLLNECPVFQHYVSYNRSNSLSSLFTDLQKIDPQLNRIGQKFHLNHSLTDYSTTKSKNKI